MNKVEHVHCPDPQCPGVLDYRDPDPQLLGRTMVRCTNPSCVHHALRPAQLRDLRPRGEDGLLIPRPKPEIPAWLTAHNVGR